MRNLQLLAAFFLFFGSIDSLSSLRKVYPESIRRIQKAIVTSDRDALQDLFTSDFKLILGYKNVSADGMVDWLLDRNNHTTLHRLVLVDNPDFYTATLSFQRTAIQLIFYVHKENGKIYEATMQTFRVPTPTSTSSTPKDLRDFYEDLVSAVKEKKMDRVEELLGYGYATNIGDEEDLLDSFIAPHLFNSSYSVGGGFFEIELIYENSQSIIIYGLNHRSIRVTFVGVFEPTWPSTSTETSTTSRPPITPPAIPMAKPVKDFHDALIRAVYKKDRKNVHDLLITYNVTDLNEKVDGIISHDLEYSRIRPYLEDNFIILLEYADQLVIRIDGGYFDGGIRIRNIYVLQNPVTPSTETTTRPPELPVKKFYEELVEAVRASDRKRIRELLGKNITTNVEGGRENLINKFIGKLQNNIYGTEGLPNQIPNFVIILQYQNKVEIQIRGNHLHPRRHLQIRVISPQDPPTDPKEFYQKLIIAINNQDREGVRQTLGKNYVTNVKTEEKLLEELTKPLESSTFNHAGNYVISLIYTSGKTITITGIKIREGYEISIVESETVRTTLPSESTTMASTTPGIPEDRREFYELLVKAIREKDEELVKRLIGDCYESNIYKKLVFKYLLENLNTSFTLYQSESIFEIRLEYTNGQRIVILLFQNSRSSKIRVEEIRVFLKPANGSILYHNLIKAIENKDQEWIIFLLGDYRAEVGQGEISKILLSSGGHLNGSDYIYVNENEFKFYFDLPNGQRIIFYGSQGDREVHISKIEIVIRQDVEDLEDLTKIERTFEEAVRSNDTNALNVLIDEDFKMIYDQEESQSNKQRIIRALLEKTLRIEDIKFNKKLTRDAPYYVTVHGVLTKKWAIWKLRGIIQQRKIST
ncbi:unnamed protein product [Caenorhabditis angaria]|uniref:Uncharacterized protein n=1 Tax=Caenorhabditis angaria TaxID=860376 RepID=A0A9P1ILW2_9PELO|nr:unnamed protein product [Caenorhabditis angaria]